MVDGLTVRYPSLARPVVEDVGFEMEAGECLAIAGTSGSGKTQTALAILGLLPPQAEVAGRVHFRGESLIDASSKRMRSLRATRLAMVFQDPAAALNPHLRIGDQLRLILEAHRLASGRAARRRVVDMLARTGLPDPERQARAWPHELSGGMRQRALIAAALIAGPSLLIADEPTTALDTTVQAQILELLADLQADTGIGLLLITHDMGVIAGSASRLLVLDDGRLVEQGSTAGLFAEPQHEATRNLIDAVRERRRPPPPPTGRQPLLEVDGLEVVHRVRSRVGPGRRRLVAVRSLGLAVNEGETLGIVGESGAGKTSLVRAVMGLLPASAGRVSLLGRQLPPRLSARNRRDLARLQLVFQDPVGSLDPSMTLGNSVAEPLAVHARKLTRRERRERVRDALARVGLGDAFLDRYPHQVSGGQAQRAAIARALITRPSLLVCDEAVAALDAPVRRGILDIFAAEQANSGLAVLFISHDLAVVRGLSHRVLVMYMGSVVELADSESLFSRPQHPYTRALIDASPVPDPGARRPGQARGRSIVGEPSSLLSPPDGCVFHPRCPWAKAACRTDVPELRRVGGAAVACHRAEELDLTVPNRATPG